MPSSLIDSAVFRDIFSTEAMRRVFSDENRVQKYLDFEAGLARAQARLGIIPNEAGEEIVRHCNVSEIDFAKLKTADRAHRLSGAAGGAATCRDCAKTGLVNGATGARLPRTSPTAPQ